MLRRLMNAGLAACAVFALGVAPAVAQSGGTQPVPAADLDGAIKPDAGAAPSFMRSRSRVYRLEADSTYRNACFDPCDCALDIRSALSGTMILTRAPSPNPSVRRYDVTDVNWRINLGGGDILVRGRGVYTWQPSLGPLTVLAHRLVLDLRIGEGATPMHFDSELIAGASDGVFPPIHIVIDMNNQVCTDQVFTLNATPVEESSIFNYRLDGDAFYQEGCLAPCLCPILIGQPTAGSFALVSLPSTPDAPEVRQWGVIRVAWFPRLALTPVNSVTTGSGFYFVSARDSRPPLNQRMLVALTRSNPPTAEEEYDSGSVPFGPLLSNQLPPRSIDITIADNAFFCYNQVYGVSAVR